MSAASKTWNITCKDTQQSEIPMGDKISRRKHDISTDIQVSGTVAGNAKGVIAGGIGHVFFGPHTLDLQANSYFASIIFKTPNASVFNALWTELEEMKRISKVEFCLVNTFASDLKVKINISKRHISVESCCESIKILVGFRYLKELIEMKNVHCVYSISTMPQSSEDEDSDISKKADKHSEIAVSDQHQFERQSGKKQFKPHGQILISASDSEIGEKVFQWCKMKESDIRLLFEDADLILKSIDKGCTKISFEGPERADWKKVFLDGHAISRDMDKMISPITTSFHSRINMEASHNVTINYEDNSTNHYGDNIFGWTDEQRSVMISDPGVDLHSNITLKTPDESVGERILMELFEMKNISKISFDLLNNVSVHKEVKVIIQDKNRSSKKCCESIDLLIEYHHLKKLIEKNGVHRVYWMSTLPPTGQDKLPLMMKEVGCLEGQDFLLQSNMIFKVSSGRATTLLGFLKRSSIELDLVDNVADLSEVKVVMKKKHTSSTECCKSIDRIIDILTLCSLVDGVDRVYWIATTGALNEKTMKPALWEEMGCQSLNSRRTRKGTDERKSPVVHYGPRTNEDRRITIGRDCGNVSSGNKNSGPMNAYVAQEQ